MERSKKVNGSDVSEKNPSHYRNILVTINGKSEPRWVNKSEFNQLLEKGVVNTATINGKTKQYEEIQKEDEIETLES